MADKVKSPILMLVILILVSLFLAGGVFYLLQKEKANNLALQAEIKDLKTQQKIAETKFIEAKKIISGLEVKLQEAQDKIETLTHDLDQEKTTRQEVQGKTEQLKTELEEQKKARADLEDKLVKTQEDMKKIEAQLQELDSKKLGLEARIKDLETQLQQAQTRDVELGKIVVAPEGSAGMQAEEKATAYPAEGKILVINKDYNFVVINLGSKDGIREGDIFSVYHNDKYISDIKVDKIHESMSAAGFVSTDMKDRINEGDKVIQKTK